MVQPISQILFTNVTTGEQIVKFQLAIRAWHESILRPEIVKASNFEKREYINQWIRDFDVTFKTNQAKINVLSAFKGVALSNGQLGIDMDIEEFLDIYRNTLIRLTNIDFAKAVLLERNLASTMNDYDTFYKRWDEYLDSAYSAGLSQNEKVKAFLKGGGKEFTALIDSSGRKWTPDRYASMYSQTRSGQVYDDLLQENYISNGGDIVQVSNHGTTTTICKQFEGQYFSLTGKTNGLPILPQRPPFHPNCKHRLLARPIDDFSKMKKTNDKQQKEFKKDASGYSDAQWSAIKKQTAWNNKNRPTMAKA